MLSPGQDSKDAPPLLLFPFPPPSFPSHCPCQMPTWRASWGYPFGQSARVDILLFPVETSFLGWFSSMVSSLVNGGACPGYSLGGHRNLPFNVIASWIVRRESSHALPAWRGLTLINHAYIRVLYAANSPSSSLPSDFEAGQLG